MVIRPLCNGSGSARCHPVPATSAPCVEPAPTARRRPGSAVQPVHFDRIGLLDPHGVDGVRIERAQRRIGGQQRIPPAACRRIGRVRTGRVTQHVAHLGGQQLTHHVRRSVVGRVQHRPCRAARRSDRRPDGLVERCASSGVQENLGQHPLRRDGRLLNDRRGGSADYRCLTHMNMVNHGRQRRPTRLVWGSLRLRSPAMNLTTYAFVSSKTEPGTK
jgi:hypothetical protein